MLKYIVLALVGLGIYIGVTYKDQIEDLTDSRSFEDVQDVFEDVSDKASDTANELSDKFEELKN
ncbi:YtxH domain-containing protein [Photobacterium sp. BZF1]|uniref:YtxH domain-containing protein n=1 Tax=Photobacterium sp. BZF1 TaxID=1904457 RepID=UPI001653DCE0|nr:YtxH domain-containing protein [Photobacterium sp. BZF1]MBC7004811.1 YtxH domain-containing protein [Photobacterium sp. BZF1]